MLTNTSGFVYYVSMTGITGSAIPDYGKVGRAVARIKRHTDLPVAVGFGVKNADTAETIARGADGVVVGTALVEAIRTTRSTRIRKRHAGHGGSRCRRGARHRRRRAAGVASRPPEARTDRWTRAR